MNRQASSAARLASTLLIVGLVALACGRHDVSQGTPPAGQTPTAVASAVAATPNTAPTVLPSDTPEAPAASDSATPATSYSPPATADDPVTGEIQSIDQLIKGIDGSVSSADSGTNGGE